MRPLRLRRFSMPAFMKRQLRGAIGSCAPSRVLLIRCASCIAWMARDVLKNGPCQWLPGFRWSAARPRRQRRFGTAATRRFWRSPRYVASRREAGVKHSGGRPQVSRGYRSHVERVWRHRTMASGNRVASPATMSTPRFPHGLRSTAMSADENKTDADQATCADADSAGACMMKFAAKDLTQDLACSFLTMAVQTRCESHAPSHCRISCGRGRADDTTIAAIERDLVEDGFVSAGAPQRNAEGAFLACSCWLAECQAMQGRLKMRARPSSAYSR